jgi:hypothetical protein
VAAERDIIFEFLRLGRSVKVTAVDAASGVEVAIIGDAATGEAALKKLAQQKLDYVIARRGGNA